MASTDNYRTRRRLISVFCVSVAAFSVAAAALATKPASYMKPASAKTVLKGKVVPYRLWFDERKWQQRKPIMESHESYFEHVEKDVYGSTIYDQVRVSLKSMRGSVIANARTGGLKDLQIIDEQKRVVNGKELLYLLVEGNFKLVPMGFHIIFTAANPARFS